MPGTGGFPKDDLGVYVTLSILKKMQNGDSVQIYWVKTDVMELIIWKKIEEYLRLFETYGGNRFSLLLMSGLRKLISFWRRMGPSMKLIAQKELIILFQMAPSRILCDQ